MEFKIHNFTAGEVNRLNEDIYQRVAQYFIGLANIAKHEKGADATLAGSGTLVKANGRYAVLTADHVLNNLNKRGFIGLILPTPFGPRFHKTMIDAALLQRIPIGKASYDADGPDLGLLVLSRTEVDKLPSTKTCYNLEIRREEILANPPPLEFGNWIISGMAEEWTVDLPPERSVPKIKGFSGQVLGGIVRDATARGDFDFLSFEVTRGEKYDGPDNFQGYSGGALWQARLVSKQDRITVEDVLLSGVIYYQLDWHDDRKVLRCHGRKSVYEQAFKALSELAT
jgi:hypothetical protein